jgi:uncharacterized protein (DUF2147 family)
VLPCVDGLRYYREFLPNPTHRGSAMLLRMLTIGLLLIAGFALADDRDAVFGRWASNNSILEINETNGVLHATIVSILDPLYKEGEEGPVGTTRVDLKNPTASLRARPIVGMDLLDGYQYRDGKWQGQLYDPESGKLYKSQITRSSDGKLQIRGYIGAPMFGRTAVFEPVSSCTVAIAKMLAEAKLETC